MRRWRDILVYAALAALIAVPLGVVIARAMDTLFAPTAELSPNLSAALRWSVYVVLLWIAWVQSGTRVSHFRLLHCYPPTLVAVPIALWTLVGFLYSLDPVNRLLMRESGWEHPLVILAIATTGFIGVATIAALVLALARRPKHQCAVSSVDTEILRLPFEELQRWLSTEAPIKQTRQDFFRADARARRVFAALQTVRKDGEARERRQTVVVQGPFGSGKSSIVQLVENFAAEKTDERYVFAHVNCWGFSSISAQEHVLEGAVAALSRHVDCLAVRHVPAAYADALSETSSWLKAVVRVLKGSGTPVVQLQRFTPILRAIGAQLMIVVEDTDRNGPDFDQKHIEAMLHNFREVERVSFVLTAGAMSEIDFPKIAEHILFMPPLGEETTLALLDRIRDHCQTEWKNIDPTPTPSAPRNRPISLKANASTARAASGMFHYDHPDWAVAVAALLNTPRHLKRALAAILSGWETLNGEVDVDELIMLTTLRNCAPAVFTFFGIHFHEFKILSTESRHATPDESEARKERLAYVKARWQRVAEESGYDARALGAIMGELVYASSHVTGVKLWSKGNRCQSIGSSRGEIYWERLTSESVSERGVRDQEVLRAIQSATTPDGIEALGRRFAESTEFAELVVFFDRFSRQIDDSTLLQVASVAVRKMRPLEIGAWNRDPASFGSLKTWVDRFPYSDVTFRDWLAKEMELCLPNGLRDANALFFDFGRRQLDMEAQGNVRERFVARVKEHFAQIPTSDFAAIFDPDYPYSLGHLVRLDRKPYPEMFLTRGADWQWLAPLVLEAMRQCPQVIVPQVMIMFGNYGPSGQMPTWFKYDEEELQGFFGERLSEAVLLLSQELIIPPTADGWFQLAGPLGTKAAQDLGSRENNVSDNPEKRTPPL
jgi:hypothetical protein